MDGGACSFIVVVVVVVGRSAVTDGVNILICRMEGMCK